jgi:6-phosphogluconolactonase
LIVAELMQGAGAAARFMPLYPSANLDAFPWPAAAQVLGMGADGHIASLFPGSQDLPGLLAPDAPRAAELDPGPGKTKRVSLSAPTLLSSRWTALLIFGEDKRVVLSAARHPGSIAELPVRVLLAKQLTVYWAP